MKPDRRSSESVQRVAGAIGHKGVDRIPSGEITIEDAVVMDTLACVEVGFDQRLRFTSLLGLDLYCLSPKIASPAGKLPRPDDFDWPCLRSWLDRSGLFIFAVLDGPFGWGIRIFGFREFFTLHISDQDALRSFNQSVEDLNVVLAHRLAEQGIHALILADDIAYRSGLFIGPDATRKHFLPCLKRQAEQMLSLVPFVFFHSDGNFMDLLPEITAMGFHGLHCIDPESGMDYGKVRSRVGPGMCLWGTLASRELERCAAPDECGDVVRRIRSEAATGSFILGTTSGLFKGLDIGVLRSIYSQL